METRIAVTPAEGTVVHPQALVQCFSGLLYLPVSRDPETGRSVFEIRGDAPDGALKILQNYWEIRGAIFEIFEVEGTVETRLELEVEVENADENEFAEEFEDSVLLEDNYGTQDPAERQVVATA